MIPLRPRPNRLWIVLACLLAGISCAADALAPKLIEVPVQEGVKLEVVDWGGVGRPLVLIGGLGSTAHSYEGFARKLIPGFHVFGITRRGFGASSVPESGYDSDRLGDDVVAVIDTLKLDRPVLVGHSLGGIELSSVGARHPEKVAGLVYLEAAWGYAYFSENSRDPQKLSVEINQVRRDLSALLPGSPPDIPAKKAVAREVLAQLPELQREIGEFLDQFSDVPDGSVPSGLIAGPDRPGGKIFAGTRKYVSIPVPILAFFAVPHSLDTLGDPAVFAKDKAAAAKAEALDAALSGSQADAFEKGLPTAQVIKIAHASHFIFDSNEEEVLREMRAFVATLR